MATRFYYPAFRSHVERLNNFLSKHQGDMVHLNAITDPQLTQLQNLKTALDVIATDAGWPTYKEVM